MLFFRKIVLSVTCVAAIAFSADARAPISLRADMTDDYRYEEKYWNKTLWEKLKTPPPYIAGDHVFDLPEWPVNRSAETVKEIAYIDGLTTKRTPETVELIHYEARSDVSTVRMVGRSGAVPSALWKLPEVLDVLHTAYYQVSPYFVIREKKRFARPRPSHLAPQLDLVIENPAHAAYPSGHATESRMIARLAAALFPADEAELIAYGNAIAHRREIAGVHYPSDSAAGQMLGDQIAELLMKHPDFKKKMDAAKAAIAAAR